MEGNGGKQTDQRHRSRRTVLKTLGSAGVAAATLPTRGYAASNAGFVCSLDIPAYYTKDEKPLSPNKAGKVYGSMEADGIWIPNKADTTDCGWVGDCDGFRAWLPFTLSWKTTASRSEMGEVYANVSVRLPGAGRDTGGWSWVLRDTAEKVESESSPGSLTAEYHKKNVSQNLFRAMHVELELDFRNSNVADGTRSETAMFAVPNHGLMSSGLDLLEVSETVYNTGVRLADDLTRVPLDDVQQLTQLWAGAQVSGVNVLTGKSLTARAARSGISAFKKPIEERQAKEPFAEDVEAVETVAGPAVGRLDG